MQQSLRKSPKHSGSRNQRFSNTLSHANTSAMSTSNHQDLYFSPAEICTYPDSSPEPPELSNYRASMPVRHGDAYYGNVVIPSTGVPTSETPVRRADTLTHSPRSISTEGCKEWYRGEEPVTHHSPPTSTKISKRRPRKQDPGVRSTLSPKVEVFERRFEEKSLPPCEYHSSDVCSQESSPPSPRPFVRYDAGMKIQKWFDGMSGEESTFPSRSRPIRVGGTRKAPAPASKSASASASASDTVTSPRKERRRNAHELYI